MERIDEKQRRPEGMYDVAGPVEVFEQRALADEAARREDSVVVHESQRDYESTQQPGRETRAQQARQRYGQAGQDQGGEQVEECVHT